MACLAVSPRSSSQAGGRKQARLAEAFERQPEEMAAEVVDTAAFTPAW
jgi:hypothetical protein